LTQHIYTWTTKQKERIQNNFNVSSLLNWQFNVNAPDRKHVQKKQTRKSHDTYTSGAPKWTSDTKYNIQKIGAILRYRYRGGRRVHCVLEYIQTDHTKISTAASSLHQLLVFITLPFPALVGGTPIKQHRQHDHHCRGHHVNQALILNFKGAHGMDHCTAREMR